MDAVIRGQKRPERVHFVEELVDPEVIGYITRTAMEETFPELDETWASIGSNTHLAQKVDAFVNGGDFLMLDGDLDKIRLRRDINFYYRMGFDYLPDLYPWTILGILLMSGITKSNIMENRMRRARDTAQAYLSRGMRNWQEEERSCITSWKDFERIPWHRVDLENIGLEEYLAFIEANLPDGMKTSALGCLFDPGVIGTFFSLEDFCYFLYDKPDLLKEVVDRYGQLNYELYQRMIGCNSVGFAWHADDLGYHSQTLISVEHLRQYILPWIKRYADLAHAHGKTIWLHSCGNVYDLMPDFLNMGIDAKHSFEDSIMPVGAFMSTYGDRVAALGGIDMDKLCRLPEPDLRRYCRSVLDECLPYGRYAYGSANTIANYVPLVSYMAMLEEGYNYL
jgi:uroporphyrinogen decarboxylase